MTLTILVPADAALAARFAAIAAALVLPKEPKR